MKPCTRRRRSGTVVVVVTVALIAILSIVALSLDGGALLDVRRQAQSAADAAAIAAAGDLYANWWTYQGLDPGGTAAAAAQATAAGNGFVNGANGCTVQVHIPPQSGLFAGKAGHVEVLISVPQQRYFSRLFGTDVIMVGTRAVARGQRGGIKNGIIVLDPVGKGALNAGGTGGITVSGAPILVDSNHAQAMIANGGGTLTAPEFDVVGNPGWDTPGGGTFNGTIVPASTPTADPLANLPAPDPNALPVQSRNKTQISGGNTVTLQPGVYQGGINITGKGNVTLAPGTYYMQGGGFSWSGQGDLTGTGVTIYNDPRTNSDQINLSGQGTVNLSAPTAGPYQGMLLFQNRSSTVPMGVTGNGGMSLSGTLYAAGATLTVTGNGTTDVIGAQYISYNLVLGGNGSFSVSWKPNTTPGTRNILLVE